MNDRKKEVLEWVYCILIAVVLCLFVKYFIGTLTVVKQESMYSTLKSGDRLVLNRLPKTFKQMPKAGDIITFEAPSKSVYSENEVDLSNPVARYEKGPKSFFGKFTYYALEINKKSYIKRVIGLPGDHIQIKDGKVYKNGEELNEPYLDKGTKTEATGMFADLVVPENAVFAMGDNRGVSLDCRVLGCIPMDKIEGVVVFRFWPLNKIGKVQ